MAAHLKPDTCLTKLYALRERERLYHVIWGFTRWASLVLSVLFIACIVDWRVDKFEDTPTWLRYGLTSLIAVTALSAGWFWLVLPWTRGPALIPLAHRVEKHYPEFDHRLITAIQLTRQGAQTQGMSQELIENLTREAEGIADKRAFSQLADIRRIQWSAGLLAWPLLVTALCLLFFGPSLLWILIQRQGLRNIDVPRDHQLVNHTKRVWPMGDEVTIEYEVIGKVNEEKIVEQEKKKEYFGIVRVYPEGHNLSEYSAFFHRRLDDERTIFRAVIPGSSLNFKHRAWIGDGRSRKASEVVFEPRPEVTIGEARVDMPPYVPKMPKPDGTLSDTPYSTVFKYGDVKGLLDSVAHVEIFVQKPVTEAKLLLYQREANGKEKIYDRVPAQRIDEVEIDGTRKTRVRFDFKLTGGLSGYKPEVWDINPFSNDLSKTPRRDITIQSDQPPIVQLLPERYSIPGLPITEEDILQGMPIPLGSTIPIEYFCRSAIGFAKKEVKDGKLLYPAVLVYRVNDGPEYTLDLEEISENAESGAFDPQRCAFENTAYQQKVLKNRFPFVACQIGVDLQKQIPRQYGGGRYDFQTAGLRVKKSMDPEAQATELIPGDRVEFYVKVRDCKGDWGQTIDRRGVEVRSLSEVIEIALKTIKSEERLRELTRLQQSQFGGGKIK